MDKYRFLCALGVLCCCLSLPQALPAAEGRARHLFKVASLAPAGSLWAKSFDAFVAEVRDKSAGDIDFKTYAGGVMGDDRAVLRKMRVGQLHGGGFTMSGISEVVPEFMLLSVPFLFKNYAEADHLQRHLLPDLRQAFARKNLALISVSEVGFVYPMSTRPLRTLEEFRSSRVWVPAADTLNREFLENLGAVPTQLSIPDVLPALSTGIINVVFNSFYGSLVLQWHGATPFITDVPFSYAYSAFVLDGRVFERLSAQQQALLQQLADKHFGRTVQETRKGNAQALEVLRKGGATLVVPTDETLAEIARVRDKTMAAAVGRFFPEPLHQKMVAELLSYRQKTGAGGR